jgi:2-keto-4-pentenoate hydratase/2-oxohepta-3-ene-1,7-dioic acid hydratase in catechol pathway
MRLLSRAAEADERLAVVDDAGAAIDVADLLGDGPWTMGRLLASVEPTLAAIREALAGARPHTSRDLATLALLPPIGRPGKIIAVGRNYREHAAEEGRTVAPDPVLFTKFSTALVGDRATVVWRATDTAQVDYEAELAVVIGRTARDVPAERALDHVLGYACLDDISARDLQAGDGQWVRGKSLDTFCPFGPWLVTRDEIPDPGVLAIRCLVNGEIVQDANTRDMVHGVPALIAFCSRFMTLEPGDVIATGTPGGVGAFRQPPRFLGDGDEVVVEIDGIGRLTNTCHIAEG